MQTTVEIIRSHPATLAAMQHGALAGDVRYVFRTLEREAYEYGHTSGDARALALTGVSALRRALDSIGGPKTDADHVAAVAYALDVARLLIRADR